MTLSICCILVDRRLYLRVSVADRVQYGSRMSQRPSVHGDQVIEVSEPPARVCFWQILLQKSVETRREA